MANYIKGSEHRTADHPVESIFVDRWSPRSMSGEGITDQELNRLFEAARWAPSSFNEQPWRFLYAKRNTPDFKKFLELLAPANHEWCGNAAVLMVVVSRKNFSRNEKPNRVNVFDSGAAWVCLALQGASMDLVVHGMAGFDVDKARTELKVPDAFEVTAMIAVGKPGDLSQLPEALREREVISGRKKVSEIAMQGQFRE